MKKDQSTWHFEITNDDFVLDTVNISSAFSWNNVDREEQLLREKYPALNEAWKNYQALLKLYQIQNGDQND
jgi:hypothetical protein